MDTAVFHDLTPDTNRIAHAMRGHLVALWGFTCECGNFSIPNNTNVLLYVNSTSCRPMFAKLVNLFEMNNFLHLSNRVISKIVLVNLLNKTFNVSDLINLKRISLCVGT